MPPSRDFFQNTISILTPLYYLYSVIANVTCASVELHSSGNEISLIIFFIMIVIKG